MKDMTTLDGVLTENSTTVKNYAIVLSGFIMNLEGLEHLESRPCLQKFMENME